MFTAVMGSQGAGLVEDDGDIIESDPDVVAMFDESAGADGANSQHGEDGCFAARGQAIAPRALATEVAEQAEQLEQRP
jgi:hypothetical protein